jgi:type II secretory pathway component PulJ
VRTPLDYRLELRARRTRRPLGRAAFSLIEIMVTVALLSFIILGLLAMFNQTQRAFRTGMTQIDVLETGRILTDMLGREIEQMAPSHAPYRNRLEATNYANFLIESTPRMEAPLLQGLPGTTFQGNPNTQDRRTNIVQRFFFLSKLNQDWVGTGYQVVPDYPDAPVGTLYRYTVTNRLRRMAAPLSGLFQNAVLGGQLTNISRVADGVVHLRVRPYAPNGVPFVALQNSYGAFLVDRVADRFAVMTNVVAWRSPFGETLEGYFLSNAVPAAVELELGVLEQGALERYRSIGQVNRDAQLRYLSNHVGQVHLFRQRIPIRNVDLSAYK